MFLSVFFLDLNFDCKLFMSWLISSVESCQLSLFRLNAQIHSKLL